MTSLNKELTVVPYLSTDKERKKERTNHNPIVVMAFVGMHLSTNREALYT